VIDVWDAITYPLAVRDLQRLAWLQATMAARVWLYEQQLPCSLTDARHLAFVRWLVISRRLRS
jgi:hypothetical protein